jgi:hypothetical protein
MEKANINTISAGDSLFADAGFDCMNGRVTVACNETGALYVPCACGRHYLDGQADGDGVLVGLTPHRD